ncbi:MAG: leucine-rich repeat protein [Clostridia bacterium]|nr:leucine-rich repeat protein [Clostridia bacterium]
MSLRRSKLKRSAIACLSITMCLSLAAGCADLGSGNGNGKENGTNSTTSLSYTDVTKQFDTANLTSSNFNSSVLEGNDSGYETRTVIVALNGSCILDLKSKDVSVSDYLQTPEGFAALREIDREQKTFFNKLTSQGIKYEIKSTYTTVANAVAIEVNTSYVSKIKNFGGVANASIAQTYLAPKVEESSGGYDAVSNDAFVYKTGIYDSSAYSNLEEYPWGKGDGVVVAVIDTGLDYTHEAFQMSLDNPRMSKSDVADLMATSQTPFAAAKRIAQNGGTLTVDDVYVSEKIPFAFDYADDDADVYPSYSNHGTHVAGIIGGYNEDGYDDKDGNPVDEPFTGVAPHAQLVICKTFTDNLDSESLGGAESQNIMSALEDCANLGVDVINMSLGTTAGFTTTDDGDWEGQIYNAIFDRIQKSGISLICAASNDYSAGYGSVYGTNLASNPDSGTVGSPSTYYAALSVASISGQKTEYLAASDGSAIFIENASSGGGEQFDFIDLVLGDSERAEFEYVNVGLGQKSDYRNKDVEGKIVLIKRGVNSFQEKIELAAKEKAKAAIVWNNVSGTIRMSLGDVEEEDFIPAVSITMDAGNKLLSLVNKSNQTGTLTMDKSLSAGPFMSNFSSWGPTPDLKIKPEITAHGGEITSTVPGGYNEQSGTSMAAPNMAGLTALVRNYVKSNSALVSADAEPSEIIKVTNQLMLSTASTARDENGLPYSPRKQGSGLANLDNIVNTGAYAYTDADTKYYYDQKDGRPKIEIGYDKDGKAIYDKDKTGVYSFNFKVKNFRSDKALTFVPQALFMTETLDSEGIAVAERAKMLDKIAPEFSVNGKKVEKITVAAGESVMLDVTLRLHEDEKKYLDESFENGMFVEGFIKLVAEDEGQCELNVPFLSFYGDWEEAPMLDYTAFEIAEFEQDSSILDDQKPSATIWPTQPFGSYNDDNFVIPLGSYLYTVDESADPMYANMEYCAISMFNDIVSEEGIGNYVTTYSIRCVYAGLLRNAKYVNYKLYDAQTGEVVTSGVKNRLSKAYASGGSARPAFIELRLTAAELGLMANGKYTMEMDFRFNENSKQTEENTFKFDFYVDYEAPVLKDARLRYFNTTDANNKDIQKIYLDLDVFDNHYAQSIKLCYLDDSTGKQELKLATDYVTPVRNANKNGTTTVSIEVTDIWDKYKDTLAVELDDYALNHTTYLLRGLNTSVDLETSLNRNVLPDTFELAEGEDKITIGINEMHKASLVYEGNADLSNFGWSSPTSYIEVKNGEIVGRKCTNGKAYPVLVTNHKGVSKEIYVTVTDTVSSIKGLSFDFGTIITADETLHKPGNISQPLYAGEDVQLEIVATPWYYNGDFTVSWSSNAPDTATVDENGLVHTKKKGSVTISATITANGMQYFKNASFNVQNEFTVSNMSLTRYRGEGETYKGEPNVVVFPSDLSVISIGEDAFKDNTVIRKVIIPKTVTEIGKNAFKGCTNLEGVYFISDDGEEQLNNNPNFVADSDLKLINKYAFEGCTSLKVLDLSYVKVITLGKETFKDCVSLEKIVKSSAIGTAYDRAFIGCSSLTSFDATGLHVAGANVFSGCTSLNKVETGKFTALGAGMFAYVDHHYVEYDYSNGEWVNKHTEYEGCTNLKDITILTSTVGYGAFANSGLQSVTFKDVSEAKISASAFENCEDLTTVTFTNSTVKSIGSYAFANTNLNGIKLPAGIEYIGAGAFSGVSSVQDNYTVTDNAIISGTVLLKYIGGAVNSYTLPAGVTSIAPYAFADAEITSIDLSGITEIGEGAFLNSRLETVTFGNDVKIIGASAFQGTNLTSLAIPVSVTYVGDYAFAETNIQSVNYAPTNAVEFGSGVFNNCKNLTVAELGGNLKKIGDRTFEGCIALTSAKLPAVTSLGAYTFFNTPALTSATFADGAITIGTYTFASERNGGRLKFTNVTIPATVTTIGDGAFYNCTKLTTISLATVNTVENYAFYNCNSLVVSGLANVENIGDYAFYNNNKLGELTLAKAKLIGDGAFMITSGKSYTKVSIPVAENVGKFAFFGGNEETVEIPATLKVKLVRDYKLIASEQDGGKYDKLYGIGDGAFAASPSLVGFTVASGNPSYWVDESGVLYRYAGDNGYALVAFPTAKSFETYSVADNTVSVEGHAFRNLYGKAGKIILPYSLKNIGAMAFYQSGVTDFEFKGVTAPALETEYSATVDAFIDASGQNIRGYYYANFEDYFVYYFVAGSGVNVTPLTIRRPTNGTGYDNYIYSQYFANTVLTGTAMAADTHSFIEIIDDAPEANTVAGWNLSTASKGDVELLAENIKRAHEYYNNIRNDAEQVELAGSERIAKLFALETALRDVKPIFGIQVNIVRLSASGNFKTQYKVGETFDMTGLQVIIEYDDYSTEEADMNDVTLVSPTGPLNELNNEVRLSLKGYSGSLRIRIDVTNESTNPDKEEGCGSVAGASVSLAVIAVVGLAVTAVAVSRKKDRGIK